MSNEHGTNMDPQRVSELQLTSRHPDLHVPKINPEESNQG